MSRIDSIVRDNIRNLVPYSSARDEFSGKEGIFLDANENPFGTLNRYPDPHHRKLRSAISKIKGIDEAKIFTGNGSDEAIDLIIRIFCRPRIDKALTVYPTYGMYEVSAAINDVEMIKVPLNKSFGLKIPEILSALEEKDVKVIFLCSPNNPTGNSFSRDGIIELLSRFNGIVVIDEAYIDFSPNPSVISLTEEYENLIVLQTFSKALGAAAIRTGMAFADKRIIEYFYKVKPPYNISGLNQEEALLRLSKKEFFREQINLIIAERESLKKNLSTLSIVENVFPSDANFLLVRVKNANKIYTGLLEKGIIVRNRSSVIDNCLRITVGTASENETLIKALQKINP